MSTADEYTAELLSATRRSATIEREAWRHILDGAQSYVEDAIDEDGEFDDQPGLYDEITDRARDIIKELREEHLTAVETEKAK